MPHRLDCLNTIQKLLFIIQNTSTICCCFALLESRIFAHKLRGAEVCSVLPSNATLSTRKKKFLSSCLSSVIILSHFYSDRRRSNRENNVFIPNIRCTCRQSCLYDISSRKMFPHSNFASFVTDNDTACPRRSERFVAATKLYLDVKYLGRDMTSHTKLFATSFRVPCAKAKVVTSKEPTSRFFCEHEEP